MAVVIDLPWPDRTLHPNSRVHWGKRAKAAKKARTDAAWATHAARIPPIAGSALNVTAVFYPPDSRHRDIDGMLANIKPALDGIADVIGIDDSKWTIALRKEASRPPHGAVQIQIEVTA